MDGAESSGQAGGQASGQPSPAAPPKVTRPTPSMTDEQRLTWAEADQKMRVRRYLRRIAVRILAVPLLFVVPHSWVPATIVLAVIAGMSAVIGGNDPDAARDFIHDDGTIIEHEATTPVAPVLPAQDQSPVSDD